MFEYFQKSWQRCTPLALLPIVFALAACSSGSSTSAVGRAGPPPGGTTPAIPATSQAPQFVFHVILDSTGRRQTLVASTASPVLPPGITNAGPVSGGIVTFPDGSTEIADVNGKFTPSQSQYAALAANAPLIATQLEAQPYVKITDPTGASGGSSAVVPAYDAANAATLPPASAHAGSPFLAGMRTLPAALGLYPGAIGAVTAQGTDFDDEIASITPSAIVWSALLGTVTPIPGTVEATYTAKTPGTDVITASITIGGRVLYSATTSVTVFDPATSVAVSGKLVNASGMTIPNGTALFAEDDKPRALPAFNFFAQANGAGIYPQLYVPAQKEFNTAIGVPAVTGASSGPPTFFAAVVQSSSSAEFPSGAPGTSASVNLALGAAPTGYDDIKDEATLAIPPPITTVRDAWYGMGFGSHPWPFEADSGLQALLASQSATFPSPAQPTPVGSGTLAKWCYQWVGIAGNATLVAVDATGPSCTAAGNRAFAIAALGGIGHYSFTEYVTPNGAYPISAPLATAAAGARLVLAGTWTQTTPPTISQATSENAAVSVGYASVAAPTFGTPAYSEQFSYAYALSGGLASVTLARETLADSATNSTLQTATETKSQTTALNGPNGCVTTGAQCYSASGTFARSVATPSGTIVRTYTMTAKLNGDGSSTRTAIRSDPGKLTTVVFPVANDAIRTSGSCIVCGSSTGTFDDIDGKSQLGSFTIGATGLVSFELLDTIDSSAVGAPIDALNFIL